MFDPDGYLYMEARGSAYEGPCPVSCVAIPFPNLNIIEHWLDLIGIFVKLESLVEELVRFEIQTPPPAVVTQPLRTFLPMEDAVILRRDKIWVTHVPPPEPVVLHWYTMHLNQHGIVWQFLREGEERTEQGKGVPTHYLENWRDLYQIAASKGAANDIHIPLERS